MDKRHGNIGENSRRADSVRVDACSVDLEALRAASRRGLPSFAETRERFTDAMLKREERGVVMRFLHGWSARPRLATLAVGSLLAAVFLFVPISYDRTVGQEVTFTVHGLDTAGASATGIAEEMKEALGADRIEIRMAGAGNGAAEPVFAARVPVPSRKNVEKSASSFAATLASRGIAADFAVEPILDRHRGNVYLAAANEIINVRCAGRSPDEIASDIRTQLESAGVMGADVDVTSEGGRTRICLLVPGNDCSSLPEIQCDTDPAPDGRQAKIKICRTPGMTDADLIAEIERQLQEQGLSGTVTLDESGCPKIELDE